MIIECPICYESIKTFETSIGELQPCEHKFHSECIRRWHSIGNTTDNKCPICRGPSSELVIYYDYNTPFVRSVRINLERGFKVNSVLAFGDSSTIRMPQANEMSLSCHLCGNSVVDARDKVRCTRCRINYHENCLHSLCREVGDPETWAQCVECEGSMTQSVNATRQRQRQQHQRQQQQHQQQQQDEDELDTKKRIQRHVRRILDRYYQPIPAGTAPAPAKQESTQLTRDQYKQINRQVTRALYAESPHHRYNVAAMDYDARASQLIRAQLP